MQRLLHKIFFLLAIGTLCSKIAVAQNDLPADKNATKETVNLYRNLKILAQKGFMVGHQDALAYGVGWKNEKNRSDIKDVVGDYPAVYGWELCGIETKDENNIDTVNFVSMRQHIKDAYKRGGIITLSWHLKSPFGAKDGAWDTTRGTVTSILPGGVNHQLFNSWLDEGAAFIASLKGKKNTAIPILFRPFHELSGSWFWWGANECTPDEYKALFRYTVNYMQEKKGLHNLLYIFNTGSNFSTKEKFLERYPGDDVIDMLSFDTYQNGDPSVDSSFAIETNTLLKMIGEIATEKNKLFTLAETGFEAIPYKNWFTKTLLPAIGENKISYVMLWRNYGYSQTMKKMHYYAPYKGQVSADDFVNFYNNDKTLFEREVKKAKVYK